MKHKLAGFRVTEGESVTHNKLLQFYIYHRVAFLRIVQCVNFTYNAV